MAITNKDLYGIMRKRLRDQGWEHNTHFARQSGVPYSRETTDRAFKAHPTRHISNDTLSVILKYLNFSTTEIRDILRGYTDDIEIWPMINVDGPNLSKIEEAIIRMVRQLNEPVYLEFLSNEFEMLARAAGGLDFTEDLSLLRRFTKKRG